VYLTEVETEQIARCVFFDDRLQRVANCFLLQCYTGMAYNELRAFDKAKHLHTDLGGTAWLMIVRGKTSTLCRIPLLSAARKLLAKYDYQPPVITNQKMNMFLKEVGQVAQLKNPEALTTHHGYVLAQPWREHGGGKQSAGPPLHKDNRTALRRPAHQHHKPTNSRSGAAVRACCNDTLF